MSELTREEFLSSQQSQIESAEKSNDRTVAAIRDLGKDFRSAIDDSTSEGGSSLMIGLVLTIMLTLFGTSITLIIASHMIFQGQIDSVGTRVVTEREDRITADEAANEVSKDRHTEARYASDSNKAATIAQLKRLEAYHDEIVRAIMRRLGGDGQIGTLTSHDEP